MFYSDLLSLRSVQSESSSQIFSLYEFPRHLCPRDMEQRPDYRGPDEGKILYPRNPTVCSCRYILVNITIKKLSYKCTANYSLVPVLLVIRG